MTELLLPDLVEVAARATINARCAPSYLHDIRGSMQALYSALELLGRSAKSGGDNMLKVERACDLAKRAISFHEKSTMGVLELLTATNSPPAVFDVEQLAVDAVHFLRNDAGARAVKINVVRGSKPLIHAERTKFQVLVVGLLTAAIDEAAAGINAAAGTAGAELIVTVERRGCFAMLSLGSTAGYDEALEPDDLLHKPAGCLHPRELTFSFARKFLGANGGRLEIGENAGTSSLQIFYPCIEAQA